MLNTSFTHCWMWRTLRSFLLCAHSVVWQVSVDYGPHANSQAWSMIKEKWGVVDCFATAVVKKRAPEGDPALPTGGSHNWGSGVWSRANKPGLLFLPHGVFMY